jgi:type I restriction enzyme S subunit
MKKGWQTKTLREVLAVLRNGINCKQDKSGNGDKISRIESISDARFDLNKVGYTQLSKLNKERYRLQSGDILFSHINSAIHVGKTAVFDSTEPVYHGVNLLLMRPTNVLTSAYLEHALKFLFQSGYWRGICKQSVNQASVNQQDISRVPISFPESLEEQQRIVGILDEAFAGIDTARANAEKNLQKDLPPSIVPFVIRLMQPFSPVEALRIHSVKGFRVNCAADPRCNPCAIH